MFEIFTIIYNYKQLIITKPYKLPFVHRLSKDSTLLLPLIIKNKLHIDSPATSPFIILDGKEECTGT